MRRARSFSAVLLLFLVLVSPSYANVRDFSGENGTARDAVPIFFAPPEEMNGTDRGEREHGESDAGGVRSRGASLADSMSVALYYWHTLGAEGGRNRYWSLGEFDFYGDDSLIRSVVVTGPGFAAEGESLLYDPTMIFVGATEPTPLWYPEHAPSWNSLADLKALATDKEQRWPSASAFAEALHQVQPKTRVEPPTVKTPGRCKWCDAVNPLTIK